MDIEGGVEELVSFADEDLGAPRVWGRVLGWLLVCQPDIQSAGDLAGRYRPAGAVSVQGRDVGVRAADTGR